MSEIDDRAPDLILADALNELEQLRKRVEHDLPLLRVVLDSVLEGGGASPLLVKVAEQLGLSPEPDHIFAEYNYGWRGEASGAGQGHVTVTGRSLCGRELGYGGNWCAVTQDEVEKDLGAGISLDRFCPKCVAAWPSRLTVAMDATA